MSRVIHHLKILNFVPSAMSLLPQGDTITGLGV